MSNNNIFRIHPSIGIARVGNSNEYYLGPETMAGMDGLTTSEPMGGLPIKEGQESQTITSDDLRDAEGRLKRQAARFKIYGYSNLEIQQYPTQAGSEIKVGSSIKINGTTKVVKTILWQVHLANKKANSWVEPEQGISAYNNLGQTPFIRNPNFPNSTPMAGVNEEEKTCTNSHEILTEKVRRETLVLDAGPHVVSKGGQETVSFNSTGQNKIISNTGLATEAVKYPKQFPVYNNDTPENETIESLGDMEIDQFGRLLVIGAFGKASGFKGAGVYDPNADLEDAVNNDCWYDDTADGPVTAVLVFTDETSHAVEGSSWVVSSDPSYAPQIANVVSLWEDLYNTWVENFELEPSLYTPNGTETPVNNKAYTLGKGYNENYVPKFESQVKPMLNAANLQMWATNLVSKGEGAHKAVAKQTMKNPKWKEIMDFIRNPNAENNNDDPQNATRMPLSLGDSGTPADNFLAISRTQYFFLYQWLIRGVIDSGDTLGPGELLDRNILGNCLGGRFSPGIEMTFIIRDKQLYQNWKDGSSYLPAGPFRIDMETINYNNLQTPALGVGYTPTNSAKVEPGDICKFMSIPWHSDYNSCATHTPVPNEQNSKMTYWSWPAQRPVAVYTFEDLVCSETNTLDFQRYSVRGEGTNAYYDASAPNHINVQNTGTASARVGRYQEYINFVNNWHNVGTIIQGSSIQQTDDEKAKNISSELLKESFLEVQSKFIEDDSNKVIPGPIPENHAVTEPAAVCPHMAKMKNK
ncbi:LodA/GoxA family CTQ-dependent oxidase [Polaribacter sp. SA4-12]|uniref:LodA/GoxA family CTQ-dependent oxidase n=1 Tax=Polaribacter sp. SA4-12 TaxID=1312072 RepID=UPI000B55EC93|nr:LodA/GoxA family CTQ-dependent oxidase [Polaribacter sp. SA4-12]ARV14112.1 hypothetical protein BTO07_02615 [Polaribacter sp. SA4-12]